MVYHWISSNPEKGQRNNEITVVPRFNTCPPDFRGFCIRGDVWGDGLERL